MKLCGYSERGILNSLLYEIRYADKADALLGQLIDEAVFPFAEKKPPSGKATFLIEQSLSGFGNADAIILLTSNGKKCTIFVEAKVQASLSKDWCLSDQFSKFKKGLKLPKTSGHISDLFTQLYHKQRFMGHSIEELKQRIDFPEWSTKRKRKRKIGDNSVVLCAAEKIKQHDAEVFYLSLVPDVDERVDEFFNQTLRNACLPKVPEWDTSHYGYLTWARVESFCEQNDLNNTLAVFKYNGAQIYRGNRA